MRERKIAVVVVGEVVRSPRMMNHISQLSAAGLRTLVLALARQTPELPPHVRLLRLRAFARIGEQRSKFVFLIGSGMRMALVFLNLTTQLIRTQPTHILVQNPPSFPTLASAWLAARLRGARLIVDWHNYGYSMLALRLSSGHPFVRLAAAYEGWMARRADCHLCVSQAMAADLQKRFGVAAEVLYDAPVRMENGEPNKDGCVLVVSPCGWTADERIDLILDALELLRSDPSRHRMRIHLTGDGPLRAGLEPRIAGLRDTGFSIHTGFLSEADYRVLIRSASVGVSLHESSSGLDLAMKNVDLIAASVPVCALDYGGSLCEQIREGENGYLFRTPDDLARLLQSFVADPEQLRTMRESMQKHPPATWGREWNRVALPLLAAE